MIKKILFLSLILFAFVTPNAFAITDTSTHSAQQRPLKNQIENKKITHEDLREKKLELADKHKEDREVFKEKLASLKDEHKKLTVERIDEKLAAINLNSTDHMRNSIEKMNVLLQKFSDRAAKIKAEGADTAAVDAAIIEAQAAIAAAKAAVTAQSEEKYTATINDETGLKNSMGAILKLLQEDLKTTRGTAKDAKKEVMDVARELSKLKHTSQTQKITPTPTI